MCCGDNPIPRASEEEIERRRAICRACDAAMPCKNNPEKKCTCAANNASLVLMTNTASAHCPRGKWAAVTVEGKPVS